MNSVRLLWRTSARDAITCQHHAACIFTTSIWFRITNDVGKNYVRAMMIVVVVVAMADDCGALCIYTWQQYSKFWSTINWRPLYAYIDWQSFFLSRVSFLSNQLNKFLSHSHSRERRKKLSANLNPSSKETSIKGGVVENREGPCIF